MRHDSSMILTTGSIKVLLISTLLLAAGALRYPVRTAHAAPPGKVARLRCGEGFNGSVTFRLTLDGEPVTDPITLTCGQRSAPLPAYNDLTVISYNGCCPQLNGPPDPNVTRNLPFSNNPPTAAVPAPVVNSYVCDNAGCRRDPLAPEFLFTGQFLIGAFDPGQRNNLALTVFDRSTRSAVSGATVELINAQTSASAGTFTTGQDGVANVSLEAGEAYYIKVTNQGYAQAATDDFAMFEDHAWRVALVPAGPSTVSTRVINPKLFYAVAALAVIFLIATVVLVTRRRR